MNDIERTTQLLQNDTFRMESLKVAEQLSLPDWYLAAGFLRNAIWDDLHNKSKMTPLNDIDLVYFDPNDISQANERHYQERLKQLYPAVNWEVRNQARMHLNHGHQPYQSTEHAIAHWVEIPTCVGVRLNTDNTLSFCAPFGLAHNWSLKVDINPHFPQPDVFIKRITNKKWATIWPRLKIESVAGNSVL